MSVCMMDDSPWCAEGTCSDCDSARGLKCPCKKHPKYLAKARPRVTCEECWRFYLKAHSDGT